jgi:hypothetical protein
MHSKRDNNYLLAPFCLGDREWYSGHMEYNFFVGIAVVEQLTLGLCK